MVFQPVASGGEEVVSDVCKILKWSMIAAHPDC